MTSDVARDYFEFIADMGLTKHYGSIAATRELVELCCIDRASYVLDVGCGVGATPCYLAKTAGCRVVGVDLLEKMVEKSRLRAKAEGLIDRVEFRVADAQELPFEDDLFDAVIMESVNIFFDDKTPAMREYVRVTRPGGYVGITEMTWLKLPSPELEEALKRLAFIQALDAGGWVNLMQEVGLQEVVGEARRIDLAGESRGRIERYGGWGITKVLVRTLGKFLFDPRSRRYLSGGVGAISKDLLGVVGYGVFVGRKG